MLLFWCGGRGAVTVALVLSLPLTFEPWYTVQSIAYGVVMFYLFCQTVVTPLLVKKLALTGDTDA